MGIVNNKLILMVLLIFLTEGTKSCTGENPPLGYIEPIVKPFGIVGQMITSSPAPLIGAIKRVPTWFEKKEKEEPEKGDTKKPPPKTDATTEQVQEEETALVENAVPVADVEKSVAQVIQATDGLGEEVAQVEKKVVGVESIQENFSVVVDSQKISSVLPQTQNETKPVVSEEDKQKYTEAIDELTKEVAAIKIDNLKGKFKQPIWIAIGKIEKLDLIKKSTNCSSLVKKIRGYLGKININGTDNESPKTQMDQAVKNLTEEVKNIID